MGLFLFSAVFWIVKLVLSKRSRGYVWKWSESNFYNRMHEGGLNWHYIFGIILDNAFMFFTLYFAELAFKYSQRAEMNLGVTTIFFSFTSTFVFILSYIFFHETMKWHQFTGLAIMVVAGVLICLRNFADPINPTAPTESAAEDPTEPVNPKPWEDDFWEDYYNQYGSTLPILFGMLTAGVGTIRMMGIKYYV